MNLRTDLKQPGPPSGSARSDHTIAARPVPTWHRATLVVIGLVAVLALGVGAAVAALTSEESESLAHRPATAITPAPALTGLCPTDVTNLVATIAAMPPSVQTQVMASLSPDLSNGMGNLAFYAEPSWLPPVPDNTTLGLILFRLGVKDRDAIMHALPIEQQQAVTLAGQMAAVGAVQFDTPLTCS